VAELECDRMGDLAARSRFRNAYFMEKLAVIRQESNALADE